MKTKAFAFRSTALPPGPLGIILGLLGLVVIVAVAVMGFFVAITAGVALFVYRKLQALSSTSARPNAPAAAMTVEDAKGNTVATVSRF